MASIRLIPMSGSTGAKPAVVAATPSYLTKTENATWIRDVYAPTTSRLAQSLTANQGLLSSVQQQSASAVSQLQQKILAQAATVATTVSSVASLKSAVTLLQQQVAALQKQVATLSAPAPATTTVDAVPEPVAAVSAGRLLLFNESALGISAAQINTWVAAMNQVLPDFFKEWPIMALWPESPGPRIYSVPGTYAAYVAGKGAAERAGFPFNTKDYIHIFGINSDIADAAGYHTLTSTGPSQWQVISFTFVQSIMKSGNADILYSADVQRDVVGAVMAHEVFEALVDPLGNLIAMNRKGTIGIVGDYDAEVCDPCQGTKFQVTVAGTANKVTLSDYVLPSWFQTVPAGAALPSGPFNKVLNSAVVGQAIQKPLIIAPGGYAEVRQGSFDAATGATWTPNPQPTTFWGPAIPQANMYRPKGATLAAKSGLMKRANPVIVEKETDSSLCTAHLLRQYPGAQIFGYRRAGDRRKYALRHNGETVGMTLHTETHAAALQSQESEGRNLCDCLAECHAPGEHSHDHSCKETV